MTIKSHCDTHFLSEYRFGKSSLCVLPPQNITPWVQEWRHKKEFKHFQFVKKGDRWKTFFSQHKRYCLALADISFLSDARGKNNSEWNSAFSLFVSLLSTIEQMEGSLYILGGSDTMLPVIYQNVRQTFPRLRIIGKFCAISNKEIESSVLTAIRKAAPDILFLGPRMRDGNKWLHAHRNELPPCIALWSEEVFLKISGNAQKR